MRPKLSSDIEPSKFGIYYGFNELLIRLNRQAIYLIGDTLCFGMVVNIPCRYLDTLEESIEIEIENWATGNNQIVKHRLSSLSELEIKNDDIYVTIPNIIVI
jgi:hypothetical protein